MNKRYLTPAQIYYSLANLRQITFEVTDACNLKCKYCGYGEFYDDYDRRSNKMMPFTMAKQVIDYLAPLLAVTCKYVGRQECVHKFLRGKTINEYGTDTAGGAL